MKLMMQNIQQKQHKKNEESKEIIKGRSNK